MKPFLLLGIRADDAPSDNEYASFLAFSGLDEASLRRIRLEQRPLGDIDLRDWSGIMLGGGPFNYTDPEDRKSPVQRRVEADLHRLLHEVVSTDFPFLGACYGIGALGRHEGAVLDRHHSEPVSCVEITLTPEGRADALFSALPDTFQAFTGHKEAVRTLPPHAVRLAANAACPVQAFRVGRRVYATQFHAELDAVGMCTRVDAYKNAGYFPPEEADEVKAMSRRSDVTHPPVLLRQFAVRYAVPAPVH
ncbi:MAG TPA: glutamine amidotransferase [Streptosporangiaceae bacterium]|nr:glutamine amidotransferase [Streptosporangiaceae bacterium]